MRRELLEEIGAELKNLRFLGLLENLFRYEGKNAHEHVFVFAAELTDDERFRSETVELIESDGQSHVAIWIEPSGDIALPVYPEGILDLYRQSRPAVDASLSQK